MTWLQKVIGGVQIAEQALSSASSSGLVTIKELPQIEELVSLVLAGISLFGTAHGAAQPTPADAPSAVKPAA